MNDKTLKIQGYIISSSYRTNVLKAFDDKPRFPSELAKKAGIKQNHVSNVLNELKNK